MPQANPNLLLNGVGSETTAPQVEVKRRIGSGGRASGQARGWEELQDMLHRVYVPDLELAGERDWEWTYAPSIVLRGEMEMYGQSHPRFAIRLLPFNRNARFYGFVNLRRLEETAARLPAEWRMVEGKFRAEIEALGRSLISSKSAASLKKPATVYRESPAIADCLLPVPHRMLEGYRILQAPPELALACGEGWQAPGQDGAPESGGVAFLPGWRNPAGFRGVPYMKHIRMLGAGMCAQAVCFMASALLVHRSRRIHSLAEITRRARDGRAPEGTRKQWVEIAGLNGPEIKTYFRHPDTRLNADLGVAMEDGPLFHSDAMASRDRLKVRRVQTVQGLLSLRRYLLAEVPVILSVDLDRMLGIDHADVPEDQRIIDPVYRRPEGSENRPDQGRSDHAILAVGVDVEKPETFLIHDPAMYPFVPMTAAQWESVCPYNENGRGLEAMTFIPVFPGNEEEIRWGLSTAPARVPGDSPQKTKNLLTFLNYLYRPHSNIPHRFFYLDDRDGMDWPVPRVDFFSHTFRLDLGRAADCLKGLKMIDDPAVAARFARAAIAAAEKIQAGVERWFWISSQVSPEEEGGDSHVFFWDASGTGAEPVLLLAGIKRLGGPWRMYEPQGPLPWHLLRPGDGGKPIPMREKKADSPIAIAASAISDAVDTAAAAVASAAAKALSLTPPGPLPDGMDLALMTSCLVTDSTRLTEAKAPPARGSRILLDRVLTAAKECGATCADAYCFMHQQVSALFRPEGALEKAAALDVLAAAWDGAPGLPDPAEAAARLAASCTVLPIRAFSTFLPEAASEDKMLRDRAVRALAFLLRMARELSNGPGGHAVKILEVVGGTRIERVAPVDHGEQANSELFPFVARECSAGTGLRLFLETLRQADLLAGPECRGCVFSIEKEPGDFYTINSRESLLKLVQLLDGDFADIRDRTGLNLDVPHWGFLCDDRVQMVEFAAQPAILSRITHVHLSDHYAGHFCDLPAGYIRSWDDSDWKPWLKLLPQLVSREHASARAAANLPPFSGIVSCEIEAARCLHDILRTVRGTHRMLSAAFAPRGAARQN